VTAPLRFPPGARTALGAGTGKLTGALPDHAEITAVAAFARLRDYLATRPETASGEFVLPLAATVLRALRR
jgi:hypothetical protein